MLILPLVVAAVRGFVHLKSDEAVRAWVAEKDSYLIFTASPGDGDQNIVDHVSLASAYLDVPVALVTEAKGARGGGLVVTLTKEDKSTVNFAGALTVANLLDFVNSQTGAGVERCQSAEICLQKINQVQTVAGIIGTFHEIDGSGLVVYAQAVKKLRRHFLSKHLSASDVSQFKAFYNSAGRPGSSSKDQAHQQPDNVVTVHHKGEKPLTNRVTLNVDNLYSWMVSEIVPYFGRLTPTSISLILARHAELKEAEPDAEAFEQDIMTWVILYGSEDSFSLYEHELRTFAMLYRENTGAGFILKAAGANEVLDQLELQVKDDRCGNECVILTKGRLILYIDRNIGYEEIERALNQINRLHLADVRAQKSTRSSEFSINPNSRLQRGNVVEEKPPGGPTPSADPVVNPVGDLVGDPIGDAVPQSNDKDEVHNLPDERPSTKSRQIAPAQGGDYMPSETPEQPPPQNAANAIVIVPVDAANFEKYIVEEEEPLLLLVGDNDRAFQTMRKMLVDVAAYMRKSGGTMIKCFMIVEEQPPDPQYVSDTKPVLFLKPGGKRAAPTVVPLDNLLSHRMQTPMQRLNESLRSHVWPMYKHLVIDLAKRAITGLRSRLVQTFRGLVFPSKLEEL